MLKTFAVTYLLTVFPPLNSFLPTAVTFGLNCDLWICKLKKKNSFRGNYVLICMRYLAEEGRKLKWILVNVEVGINIKVERYWIFK